MTQRSSKLFEVPAGEEPELGLEARSLTPAAVLGILGSQTDSVDKPWAREQVYKGPFPPRT